MSGSASCYGVGVQFTVREIAGPIRCKSSHGSVNRGDASIPSEPAETKCVVAIQRRVVHCRTGRAWNWRGGARAGATRARWCLAGTTRPPYHAKEQHEKKGLQNIWVTHPHCTIWA